MKYIHEISLTGTKHVTEIAASSVVSAYLDGRISLADVRETSLVLEKNDTEEYVEEDLVMWLLHVALSRAHHTEEPFEVEIVHCVEFNITGINTAEEIFCPYEEHTHIVLSLKVAKI